MMKTFITILVLTQIIGCSSIMEARRKAIDEIHAAQSGGVDPAIIRYRAMVKAIIMRNLDRQLCNSPQAVKVLFKIDIYGNVTAIQNNSANTLDKCAAAVIAAIKKGNPFPSPPSVWSDELAKDGFSIVFGNAPAVKNNYPDYHYNSLTFINALSYPNEEYYVALKNLFKKNWKTKFDNDAQYFKSNDNIVTVLGLTIEPNGNLLKAIVLKSSDDAQYDDNAIQAVQKSIPMPAPPKRLLRDKQVLLLAMTFTMYQK